MKSPIPQTVAGLEEGQAWGKAEAGLKASPVAATGQALASGGKTPAESFNEQGGGVTNLVAGRQWPASGMAWHGVTVGMTDGGRHGGGRPNGRRPWQAWGRGKKQLSEQAGWAAGSNRQAVKKGRTSDRLPIPGKADLCKLPSQWRRHPRRGRHSSMVARDPPGGGFLGLL